MCGEEGSGFVGEVAQRLVVDERGAALDCEFDGSSPGRTVQLTTGGVVVNGGR